MKRSELERRAQAWRRHHAWWGGWLSVATGLGAGAAVGWASPTGAALVVVLGAAATWWWWRRRHPRVTPEAVALHLNRICPELEESAALWLRDPASLSVIENLQRARIDAAWARRPDRERIGRPRAGRVAGSAALCIMAGLVLGAVMYWSRGRDAGGLPHAGKPGEARRIAGPLALAAASVRVVPPAYQGAAPYRLEGLDGEVPQGAALAWELEVPDAAVLRVEIAGNPEPISAASMGAGRFRAEITATDTLLYQLSAAPVPNGAAVVLTRLHTLKVRPDQPPQIRWVLPTVSRTVMDPDQGAATVAVRLEVTDDYGIADLRLVATAAKGSGEGVKFREREIPMPLPRTGVAAMTGGHEFDLGQLGLEPGDELYVYAVARDGRTPEANVTRSETRFFVLRGAAVELADPAAVLAGVNRLPQYFRSQRQLIIDTEQLLADQARLTEAQFRARAEEIGVDQKLLRLRYGQFLGEEFEADTAGAPREAEAMAFAARLRGGAGAVAGADRTRDSAIQRAIEQQHQHEPARADNGGPKSPEEIMARFAHIHDSPEAATLFDLEVKASLRSVLAAMWEAEGRLRSGQPEAALPAENRALELLKALQQADRVYVKRIGFEPAALKVDERRLRGELDAIPRSARSEAPPPVRDADEAAVRAALAPAENAPGVVDESRWSAVERRLIAAAKDDAAGFVPALELWRRRGAALTTGEHDTLRKALWRLLPAAREIPGRRREGDPSLTRRYQDALEQAGARP